jgi:hypothetical protein
MVEKVETTIAKLSDHELEAIRELEKQLHITLVAYEKSEK